jgi:DNA-binding PadR family transcriptional regulator
LVKARWVVTENKRRARRYEITASGRKHLEAEEVRWQTITTAVGQILKHV